MRKFEKGRWQFIWWGRGGYLRNEPWENAYLRDSGWRYWSGPSWELFRSPV